MAPGRALAELATSSSAMQSTVPGPLRAIACGPSFRLPEQEENDPAENREEKKLRQDLSSVNLRVVIRVVQESQRTEGGNVVRTGTSIRQKEVIQGVLPGIIQKASIQDAGGSERGQDRDQGAGQGEAPCA